MAKFSSKFSVDQAVTVEKSGKTGTVVRIVVDSKGTSLDVQVAGSKRPWRYLESELMTQAEAEKAMKAKAKAAAMKAKK